ncbi:hypothetical protein GPALN_009806 [Globodera pallida]|nr:hypothetical protein GPALN_009806 [Globodera pallida]
MQRFCPNAINLLTTNDGTQNCSNGCLLRRVETWRSVFAERAIPTNNLGIFYYERYSYWTWDQTNAIGHTGWMVQRHLCIRKPGYFLGHAIDGCRGRFFCGRPYIERKPKFGGGDVIGCGVDLATRQIIYTKNGQRLKTAGLIAPFASELFPCVSLCYSGDKIEANFGPDFEFKF